MKKFILFAVIALTATAACNSTQSASEKTNDSTAATAQKQKTDNQSQSALGQKTGDSPVKNAQQSLGLTGTYRYKSGSANNAIGIEEMDAGHLRVNITANYEYKSGGEWMANSGSANEVVELNDDTAVLVPSEFPDCQITLRFSGNKIIVKQKGTDSDCGFGASVSADGTYTKTSNQLNQNEMTDDDSQSASGGNTQEDGERIRFKAGATSATVNGRILGDEEVTYLVQARAGQTMTVKIVKNSENNDVVFSIVAPDGSYPMGMNGEMPEVDTSWSGRLKKSGDYKIIVGAMEPENADFKMSVSIR